MNLMKTLGLALPGAVLLFTSCKKDDTTNTTPGCKVTKAYTFNFTSNTPSDSAIYVYNGTKVSKLTMGGDDMVLEYSGNNITRRNFITGGSATADGYDQVSYNADGTISKIESFGRVSSTAYQAYERVDFAYTAGKISKMTLWDLTNGTATKELEYTYTFTGNNISSVDETDYSFNPAVTATYNYTYDTNANYYQKQNPQALLVDPYMGGVDGLFLPIFFSGNNVTALASDSYTLNIGYTIDDQQNLKEVSIERLKFMYNYQCQ